MKHLNMILVFGVLSAANAAFASDAPSGTPVPPSAPVASPTPTLALAANYPSIQANVFNAKCIQCHVPGGRAEAFPLNNYAKMMANGKLVVANDLVKSEIVDEIASGDMPPVRSGIPAVSALELAAIKAWILNGATAQ
jgi:mono/diheme cytochrome c family protein